MKILIYDDMRYMPEPHGNNEIVHCKTEREFLMALYNWYGETFTVMLDHDLEAQFLTGYDQTARFGIDILLAGHRLGRWTVEKAWVITANDVGRKWIASELDRYEVPYQIAPGGQDLGLKV